MDNIFLIGPMGAGKTTIGRLLANQLKKDFVDSDQEIEIRCGATISWIFDMEGEAGFRAREQRMIAELTARQNIVLATGGGAVLLRENRERLCERGTVIYLMATIEQQEERLRQDRSRPLLQGADDVQAALGKLMETRDPLYRDIAEHVIMTTNRRPRAVSGEIVKRLQENP